MKICKICKKNLLLSDFYWSKSNKSNLLTFCKTCSSNKGKKWRENNKDKANKAHREWAKLNKEKGLCAKCSNKSIKNKSLCINCWYRKVSLGNLGTQKYWKNLQELANKQKYKCIYTDELLVPGSNMSLDHIKSRKDRPDLINDITNVQWITQQMNQIKNELSHDNFIKLCKCIAERF